MKLSSIPALLLGIATGATALNQTVATNQTTAINQTAAINFAALGEWPKIEISPTYHEWYDEKLQDAIQCLAEWCESDHIIRKRGGKVRCRSPGDSGAEVFICNAYEKQRCSATTLSKAFTELRNAGTSTGGVNYETAEGSGFYYGFENFCKGTPGSGCVERYDATEAHCDREKYRWRSQKLQYDGVARKRRVEDFKYKGTTWLEKPTPKPEPKVQDWSTFRTATAANGAAPEPTPDPSYDSAPKNVHFTQFAQAFSTRVKPQPKPHGPTSIAIVPGPTGVPKA